jgi:hypothetical protein
MTLEAMYSKIDLAINSLLEKEREILSRGLGERILTNRFADYLRQQFQDYDVDAEYNGDIDKPNDRKALQIAKKRLIEIGYQPNAKNNYKIVPDIIVHERGTNANNLIVLEVKKDVSPDKDKEYDLIKLEHLTIDYLDNHYNYKLGVAIIFGTSTNYGFVRKIFFQNGNQKNEEVLGN